jgi:nitrate/nitrite transporter NarK
VPGALWAWWFGRWFRDSPADHPAVGEQELRAIAVGAERHHTGGPREPTPWRAMLSSGSLWLINVQQFCRSAGYVFFITWFTTYLRETRGISIESAGALTSLPLCAVVAGSPMGGIVSDWLLHRTGSRRIGRNLVAGVSMLACAGLIASSYWIDDALPAALLISAGSLCAAMGGPVAYAITIDMGGRHVATVFSVMNMSGNVGAAVFPFVAGWIVATTGAWDLVLFTFAGVYVVAAICWLPVRGQGTIFDGVDTRPG